MSEREKTKIAYTPVVADLFHYGHLNVLETASDISDYHVCGVITDEAANTYRPDPVSNYEERKAVIEAVEYVDEVMAQNDRDPTSNLRKIHEKYPDAEILLVHGDDWEKVPGSEFVESVGGSVVQPSYYERLSDEKIAKEVTRGQGQSQHYELFTEHFRVGDVEYFDKTSDKRRILSTKADTLKTLQPLLEESRIEETFVFSVEDWRADSDTVVLEIQDKFVPEEIVVRSSSVNEDTFESSNAGNFESVLGVDSSDTTEIKEAVNDVVESYEAEGSTFVDNQVLVQRQTQNATVSGVVFTRGLEDDSPYYVINYDDTTGKTDTVTSGYETDKVRVFRGADPAELPKRWRRLVESVKEIEEIVPDIPLDIEFGMSEKGDVTIFQVRPLTANRGKKRDERIDSGALKERVEGMVDRYEELSEPVEHLVGETNSFSDMAFWNPAEIIGENPNRLAYSLYSYVITDEAWHRALTPLGYTDVEPANLMVRFGNKPYIDLRATFNALTPADVPNDLREKLVAFYFDKLREDPALHDKIEFSLVYNCYEFGFDERAQELLDAGFTTGEVETLRSVLLELTDDIVSESGTIVEEANRKVKEMEARRLELLEARGDEKPPQEDIETAMELLDDCRELGTIPFSKLARMAFVGKALLESMVEAGAMSEDSYHAFLRSVDTVASEFERDFDRYSSGVMSRDEFLERYGHLRPGTYEITVPQYRKNPDVLERGDDSTATEENGGQNGRETTRFELSDEERSKVEHLIEEEGFTVDVDDILRFVRESVKGREYLKFEFTKNLSHSMELLAEAGEKIGLSRDEISHLDVGSLRTAVHHSNMEETEEAWRNIVKTRKVEKQENANLILPPVLFSETDLYVVPTYTARPNYITEERVTGEVVDLDKTDEMEIDGKVVLIENADPGYDWIFTKEIQGLITKYGGEASHMAIRSAEFGLPAAIGSGQENYRRAKEANQVILDCEAGKMEFR